MTGKDLKDRYVNPYTDFGFKKLFEAAEIAKFTLEEYNAYEESLKIFRDWKNVMDTAKKNGKEEGIAEGIDIGRMQEKHEIARQMKAKGYPVAVISELTDLSEEEINQL